jgi:UPF0042 nucleotide-binding protein
MNFLIITGLSGSGKTGVINALEDIGYYCIDNVPPRIIPVFADVCLQSKWMEKVAIVTDMRGGDLFSDFDATIENMRTNGLNISILFLDAADDILIKRFKETRRKHPLDEKARGSLQAAVSLERELLSSVREAADYYINTSDLTVHQLKDAVYDIFLDDPGSSMSVNVLSFGFKYGVALDADLVFDVRCLPNPFWVEELKPLTGLDSPVRDYIMGFEQSRELEDKLKELLDFLVPLYQKEGKTQLVVAFGCTGGKHRSVTFAELLYAYLSDAGIRCRKSHRDITKGR